MNIDNPTFTDLPEVTLASGDKVVIKDATDGLNKLVDESDFGGGGALSDLSDVTITSIASGELLKWSGSAWINNTLAEAGISAVGHTHTLSDITDSGTAAGLDVGTSANNVVQLDGSSRLPAVDGSQLTNLPSGSTQLSDLSDVNTSTPTNRNVLVADGVDFESRALVEADISDLQSYLLGTDIGSTVQGWDTHLDAIAGLTPGIEDNLITADGLGSWTVKTAATFITDNNILDTADIGSSVQAYSAVLDATTASFTTADETKIDFITVTQAVDLDQMETDIAALANGMVYKGDWDASAGTFPGAGVAQTGWFYYVSVAGTVDSVEFSIGDNVVATTDNASTSTYASNWSKHDQTDAVQSVAGKTGAVTLATGDITSGTFADARIAESNVTQHQAAITIGKSQISDLADFLLESEVDTDIKTLSLPASTTISTFGASLVDDLTASAARTTLDVDQAGTDNSTDVTLSGTPDYITISGQVITRNAIDLTTDVTGDLPVADGGTGSSTAAGARTNLDAQQQQDILDDIGAVSAPVGADEVLVSTGAGTFALESGATLRTSLGVDAAGTDNSTDVTLVTTSHDYLSIVGQAITLGQIDISDDTNLVAGTNITLSGDTLNVDDAFLLNTGDVGTGVYDFGGATSFELPNGATPTVDAAGEIAIDTTITDFTGLIKYHDGTEELAVVAIPVGDLTSPTNGHVIQYNATDNEFELAAAAGGGSNFASNKFTATSTWAALDSLGGETLTQVVVDARSMTGGQINVQVDTSDNIQVIAGNSQSIVVAPSTDLDLVAEDASYALAIGSYTQETGVLTGPSTGCTDVAFKTDGTKMYVADENNDSVYQYSLSTAWDVSTQTYDSKSLSVATEAAALRGLDFSDDGTKMYVSQVTGAIYQYTLSTAWDVSTGSYASKNSGSLTGLTAFTLADSGTKVFWCDDTNDKVKRGTLSTAWDISTFSDDSQEVDVSANVTILYGVKFNDIGTKMFMHNGDGSSEDLHEYVLSTAWDCSTATHSVELDVDSSDVDPRGLAIGDSGKRLYHTDQADRDVSEYSIGSTYAGTGYASINYA